MTGLEPAPLLALGPAAPGPVRGAPQRSRPSGAARPVGRAAAATVAAVPGSAVAPDLGVVCVC
jgi:hypothetical protein